MTTWTSPNKSVQPRSEVDFLFSDGTDFLFSDSTDFVFIEYSADTPWGTITKSNTSWSPVTKNNTSWSTVNKS